MIFFMFESIPLIVYILVMSISFLIHKVYFISLFISRFSWLSLYIIIMSLLSSNNLLLNVIYDTISIDLLYILLIIDAILTGALLAIIILIYSYFYSIFHLCLTMIIALISYYYSFKNLNQDFTINGSEKILILILINFLHIIYCFFNVLQLHTYRIIALSGMCVSFYTILFQQFNIQIEISLPIIFMHFIQSIRAFFLYSVVICIRNRTSYW